MKTTKVIEEVAISERLLKYYIACLPLSFPEFPSLARVLCISFISESGRSPEEVVFLCQASQDPVITDGDDPGRKMPRLFWEGAHASCSPLQGPSSFSSPSIPASCGARVVLQALLQQHHAGLHRGFYPEASRPRQPRRLRLTANRDTFKPMKENRQKLKRRHEQRKLGRERTPQVIRSGDHIVNLLGHRLTSSDWHGLSSQTWSLAAFFMHPKISDDDFSIVHHQMSAQSRCR